MSSRFVLHYNIQDISYCSCIQVKKNGHLLPELEEKSEDDFEDALKKSYCLGDYPEVYKSLEYVELSRRPESAAKKIVEGKKKRQSFFME